jgi:oligopeptidase B
MPAMKRSALLFLSVAACASTGIEPPVAKRNPHTETWHGQQLVDDYFWMRKKGTPEVESYLAAENAYTDRMMKPTEALQQKLYEEMLARIKQTDLSVPYRKRGYFYYSRTEEGKQYPIQCRKKGSLDAPEEVLLDLNELAKTQKFVGLGAMVVSDDGNLLAYSIDATGFRDYALHIKDLRSGAVLPEHMEKVKSVAWAKDGKTLFYVTDDAAKRAFRLWRHTLGADPAHDTLVYEEKDEMFTVRVDRTRSDAFLLLNLESHTQSEVRYLAADRPEGEFQTIAARRKEHQYDVEHRGDLFYIHTNDRGRSYRIVTAPVANPQEWTELVPHRDDVMIAGLDVFQDFYVLDERRDGLPRLRVVEFASGASNDIPAREPAYWMGPGANAEFSQTAYRYGYQSFLTPDSVFDYDVTSRKSKLLKQQEVLGGYDPLRYEVERIFATAADGTRVPISLVHKKGFVRNGRAPLFLNGYGSYGYSSDIYFNSAALSLLDRGVTIAIAHIRGGGEFGKKWHDHGRMMQKRNTFTDFIAAAEHLVREKYTSSDRLAISGGSAGGLLMGAVTNMRPDLFKVVVAFVPFVDVINTMLDESLPLTVAEFEEWGNPKIKDQFDYMLSYSPYDNVAKKAYPVLLVKSAYNDSQVMYWEPTKWVAKLRASKTDHNLLLLKMDMDPAGHGGKSGRYERLHETAFYYAFMLWQLGISE